MEKLITQLLDATSELKSEYLLQTKIWAESRFASYEKKSKWSYEQWKEKYPLRYFLGKTEVYSLSGKGRKEKELCYKVVGNGLESFLKTNKELAELHYQGSIERLAFRLTKNGVVEYDKLLHSRLKQNFEIEIMHGDCITRAWTIIASGAVQKPHYRFLVKTRKAK